MKSTSYSEKVLDHFRNPRNVGTLKGNDVAVGRVGNPVCGDLMEIYIRVKNNIIEDIKFKTFGCGSAIATASMITELAKGKTLEQAMKITRNDVAEELDGLPPIKMHCSNLAADALKDAINNYLNKEKTDSNQKTKSPEIICERKYLNNGVYTEIGDIKKLSNKRIVIIDDKEKSIDNAIRLKEVTPRVVLITRKKESMMKDELRQKLTKAGIKILYESEIIEVKGDNNVEKIVIHDLNEDETYELFTDAVIT